MNRTSTSIVTIIAILSVLSMSAKKQADYPRAEIKVGYTYHETFVRGSDGIIKRDIPFILLASKGQSKFYNAKTEFKDSLESTPQGRAVSHQLLNDAVKRYAETEDRSAMDAVAYQTFLYIFRSTPDNQMTVYDKAGSIEQGYYTEPLGEIVWEISDSTKSVLGYYCVMATANYHGRHWIAWFAPDIPLQEGPWKLTGLPGLILEASESTGQHSFVATGLEASNQEIVPIYPYRQYDKMTRIEMLRQLRNYRDHHNAIDGAAT
ncbi:MAG: GLPGLI family protein, partial [Muribaculaceae bacterium]|nr:GLPGLI family protein [Muribaculaceae bacterium]